MRILYLAPPSPCRDRITAHSFIDEEIAALSDAGVDCLTLSDAIVEPETRRGVRVEPVAASPTAAEVAPAVAFAARHAAGVPFAAGAGARHIFHAIRIEFAAARAVRNHDVDLIHSHFGWPGGLGGALAAADARVPLVASVRGMDVLCLPEIGYGLRRDPAYDRAIRRLLRVATRTVYASDYMRRQALHVGARLDRTVLVRKGVDLARFHPSPDRPASRRALGISGPILLAVGSLSPRKGFDVVLDALALLRDKPWTFVACGDGPDRGALEDRARAAGIADRVIFAGPVGRAAIGGYFSAADIFVHGAVMEAAGNVILEALAAGCPVVCTDSGGPAEYVLEGETGFVVAPGDREALAERIGALLRWPALRTNMSRRAREVAERDYSYRRMIADYVAVYRTALQATGCSLRQAARTRRGATWIASRAKRSFIDWRRGTLK